MPATVPINVARAAFLRLMIPQLAAGGWADLAARYAVELGRLEGRTPEEVREEFTTCAAEGHQNGSEGNLCLFCQKDLSL